MSLPIHHMIERGPRPVAPFSHAVEADGWASHSTLLTSWMGDHGVRHRPGTTHDGT